MKKEHLINFFPFLVKEFRRLEKKEITNESVFKELFPGEEVKFSKLNAVYQFQLLDKKIKKDAKV